MGCLVRLSISSFKLKNEPLRTAAAAAAIVVGYNVFIAVVKPDAVLNFDAGTRNVAIAERYLYGPTAPAVITGSSMGFRLAADYMEGDYLGAKIFNLSLAGKTALPGLDMIIARRARPRLAFVEMNTMDRRYDRVFAADRLSEPGFTIRRFAPGFRTENRPLDIVIVYAWRLAKKLLGDVGMSPTQRVFSPGPGYVNKGPPVDDDFRALVAENMRVLARRIDILRAAGVRIVLLRMPSDPAAENASTAYMWRRNASHFPPSRYAWFDLRTAGTLYDGGRHSSDQDRRAAGRYGTPAFRREKLERLSGIGTGKDAFGTSFVSHRQLLSAGASVAAIASPWRPRPALTRPRRSRRSGRRSSAVVANEVTKRTIWASGPTVVPCGRLSLVHG